MSRRSVEPRTISIHFVREALEAVAGTGASKDAVLRRAAIPARFLDEPLARVSPEQFGVLWRTLARDLQDEFFALDAHPARPGAYALLCQGLLGCADLRAALRYLCRYTSVVLDGMRVTLEVTGDTATLRLRDARSRSSPFAHATYFMVAYGLACWLIARRIPILQCQLAGRAPDFEAEYRVMFCEHIRFGEAEGALVMPSSMLSQPVVQTRDTLRPFLRRAPDVFLVKYRNTDSLAAHVRARLRAVSPPDWPCLQTMASHLGLASSTFRRRLDAEGTTFQAIKNELRRDMAISSLRDEALSIEQLAQALGFTEASAFHRAFVKWTGMRPSDYRRGVLPNPRGIQ
ncbi:MAG: AraC family transcriptional regulator [Aquabacterium sp.]|uniref:AraC family transcriptional regulator n=1 Tax=Aquabacterium sp. TaxID=1872578 RepID=UPI0027212D24|nr:AraC family transcriptional regulator [Aquabacterium sp.]MDO9003971.1 AraC family transcriptional regulator [Aquabacterium sp.]